MSIGCADEDTMEGIKTYWDADASLPTAVPNGLRCGRLAKPTAVPWARVESKQGLEKNSGPSPQLTGDTFHDYRLVTFTVWGTKINVVAALTFIMRAFDEQPKIPSGHSVALTIPNSDRLIRMEPLEQMDKLEPAPERRLGEDVWMGVRAYQIWSQRQIA